MNKNNEKIHQNEKILVAMSGGIDSAVAALLLIQKKYSVVGCILVMHEYMRKNIEDAKKICDDLNIELIIKDVTVEFERIIEENFCNEYLIGRTPNPCVLCNRAVKWKNLITVADEFGIEKIATGHYAKIEFNSETNRFFLRKSNDSKKDQTYMLWQLPQKYLKRTIFPLGEIENKAKVREFAQKNNISFFDKTDSQDICFIPDNNYKKFIHNKKNINNSKKVFNNSKQKTDLIQKGDIILDGKVIGYHNGFINFTIGQRRGLGISYKEPLYVKKIISENNSVEVATFENTFANKITGININLMKYEKLFAAKKFFTKIRYKEFGGFAKCEIIDEKLVIEFDEPRSAVAPGQSVVLYENDELVGGAIIDEVFDK